MSLNLQNFSTPDIDKNSPIPYHYQLTEIIRKWISQDKLRQGDKLPSEREFCEAFNVSRVTVRKAIDALVAEGLVQTTKGIGTFVSSPKYLEKWSSFPIGFTVALCVLTFFNLNDLTFLEFILAIFQAFENVVPILLKSVLNANPHAPL